MDWLDDRLVMDITKDGVSDMTAVQSTYDLYLEQQDDVSPPLIPLCHYH